MADAPTVTLKVLDTNPENPAKLHAGDPVYLRVTYESPLPLKILVMPYDKGEVSDAETLNDPTFLPAGKGETLGAFGFGKAAQVDEVRVFAVLKGSVHASTTLKLPVKFTWDDTPTSGRPLPDWVERLNAVADQHRKTQEEEQLKSMPPPADTFFKVVDILSLPATLFFCLFWPVWGLVRWKNKWRWLAAAPLAVAVFKAVIVAKDLSEDPTSHDFLPLEYLILAILCAIYMSIVWLVRRRFMKKEVSKA